MKNSYIKGLISLSLVVIFTGCVSTNQNVSVPSSHIVPQNKARIILQREGMFVGSACSHKVSDNNNYIGVLGNGGVMKWDRELSSFKITAKEDKGFCQDFTSATYNLKGGETYIFKMRMNDFSKKINLISGITSTHNEQVKFAKVKSQQKQALENEKHQQEIAKFQTTNDLNGLKQYTETNPNAVDFIEDISLRLALTGPKDMKVGDVRKLLKDGKSELIVISLIKRVKSPYKEFSIEEIDKLIEMGLSDKVISSMIDVTTVLTKEIERKKEQELQQRVIIKEQQVSRQQNVQEDNSNPVLDKIGEEVTKQGIKMLLDHLF